MDTLNEQLVADLARGITATTHSAIPETISWEDIETFTITGTGDYEYDDLDVVLTSTNSETIAPRLPCRSLGRGVFRFALAGQGTSTTGGAATNASSPNSVWTALYVLIEGRWFAVNDSFVEEVDQFLSRLRGPTFDLIPVRPDEAEKDYYDRLAQSAPAGFLKLDARIKRLGGDASGIELCDVLSVHDLPRQAPPGLTCLTAIAVDVAGRPTGADRILDAIRYEPLDDDVLAKRLGVGHRLTP